MQKKQQRLSGTVVVVACCFSGRHAPFFVFFTCVYFSEEVRSWSKTTRN